MGHIHDGGPESAVQTPQLGARLDAEGGIQIGQRLVQQERLRLPHHRPAERDALSLSA